MAPGLLHLVMMQGLQYSETAFAQKVITLIFCTVVPSPALPTQQPTVLVAVVISEYYFKDVFLNIFLNV